MTAAPKRSALSHRAEPRPLTVSEFLRAVNALLETQVAWVEGEVADYRVSDGKWVHFDLKDGTALVHCFGLAFRLRTPLEDGMTVRVWGAPRVYPRYGKFSLVVDILEPAGEGALQRAFELLKSALEREGLFDPARKRALPRVPERIALLTSPDAAAYADFLSVLRGRRGGIAITFVPIPVQGRDAPLAIARAIDWVSEEHPALDALVLVRGGGSLADLHAFNDEVVVRALARSRVPTAVGVGHERDVTLADLVADRRAATPSNAAELLTPTRRELEAELRDLTARLSRAVRDRFRGDEERAAAALTALREVVRSTGERVGLLGRRVETAGALLLLRTRHFQTTLADTVRRLTSRADVLRNLQRERLAAIQRLLVGLHPARVLHRGYSITQGPDGRILRAASRVGPGDTLVTTLHRGRVASTVATAEEP